jgi:hypothetical protein
MSSQRSERRDYRSYLLRLWRTQSGEAPVWRVGLEDPLTQEVWRFDDLPGLLAFLVTQTGQGMAGGPGDGDSPQA